MTSPFVSIPRSNIENKSLQPSGEENSILVQVFKEILGWYFSNNGKHRDLLLQAPFADSYCLDPKNNKQQKISIYNVSTYQLRKDPSLIIQVGSVRGVKTGLGISVEHSHAGNQMNCLQKRNIGKYNVTLIAEAGSEQTVHRLSKLLSDIFFLHIPEYYQNVIYGDSNNSQILFPQEYTQSEVLSKDFQQDSNVERIYSYSLSFEVEYESIRFIRGYDKIQIVNNYGDKLLEHDLPTRVSMGSSYPITIKTNLIGVKLYSSNPGIFQLTQISGPHGEGNGDRYYQGRAMRVGTFSLTLQDLHMKNTKQTNHQVEF